MAYTERSTIVDLLIKIPRWTSEPCGILKGPQFFQKVQNLSKKGPISQMPPLGNLIKISLYGVSEGVKEISSYELVLSWARFFCLFSGREHA